MKRDCWNEFYETKKELFGNNSSCPENFFKNSPSFNAWYHVKISETSNQQILWIFYTFAFLNPKISHFYSKPWVFLENQIVTFTYLLMSDTKYNSEKLN